MATVWMTLVLLVTLTLATTSLACSCLAMHPQQMFCASDFVVRLEVMDMEEIYFNDDEPRPRYPREVRYTVDISYVFKRSEKFANTDQSYLLTGGSDGTCRQDLALGLTYVIMGIVYNGQMEVSSCDFATRLEDITSHLFRGLHYKYQQGCNCEIQTCYGDECNVPNTRNNTCQWVYNNDCDFEYGFCTESPDTGCAWRQNRMRSGCFRRLNNA